MARVKFPGNRSTRSRDDAAAHGGELVVTAAALALFTFAGKATFGIVLVMFLAWKFVTGSRIAYWVVSLAAFGFGLLQLKDVVTGAHGDQFFSDRIFIWARCIAGLAAAALLWLSRDVRVHLAIMRKADGNPDE